MLITKMSTHALDLEKNRQEAIIENATNLVDQMKCRDVLRAINHEMNWRERNRK